MTAITDTKLQDKLMKEKKTRTNENNCSEQNTYEEKNRKKTEYRNPDHKPGKRNERRISTKRKIRYKTNKTGTSKVGAISTAQKAQKIFSRKNLNFLFFFLSENVA